SISAKKLEGSKQPAEELVGDLYSMIDKINNLSYGLDYDLSSADLVDRGLVKSKRFRDGGKGDVYKGSNQEFIKRSLQILGGAEEVYSEMGVQG
ncbi:hypothetical protein, partial [Bacillus thuringiensis]|uniref:hypothetical protein n=1 Tax=Bacillus thuringiensis TaxID=1428 RepID=UPI00283D711C